MSFLNSNPACQVARSLILEPLNCLAGGATILDGRWKDRLNVIQASLSIMLSSLLHMPPLEEKRMRKGRQRSFAGYFHFIRATISALSFEISKIARSSRRA